MRHLVPLPASMAEVQPPRGVQLQLLNGDDLNEDREDADAGKKRRRRKKRSKNSSAGERLFECLIESLKKTKRRIHSFYSHTQCSASKHAQLDTFEGTHAQLSQL